VAIVGGSGAGKSWLARRLEAALGDKAARLSLDDFYRDRSALSPARRALINYDHPRAIDWRKLESVLRHCLTGRCVDLPRYDFKSHTRRWEAAHFTPKPVILIEGLWLLRRPSVRRLFSLSIFLDAPRSTRLRRMLQRDVAARGRTTASVRDQFRKSVEPMHRRFVAPQSRRANVVLPSGWGEPEAARLAQAILEQLGSGTSL